MYTLLHRFLILFVFCSVNAFGQGHFNLSISGVINASQGHPLQSTTVFISGSDKITMTEDNGRFSFTNMTLQSAYHGNLAGHRVADLYR